ncbi:MAG: hypothetical protein DGJ47_000843 [Rickettsiaceae bacterium]
MTKSYNSFFIILFCLFLESCACNTTVRQSTNIDQLRHNSQIIILPTRSEFYEECKIGGMKCVDEYDNEEASNTVKYELYNKGYRNTKSISGKDLHEQKIVKQWSGFTDSVIESMNRLYATERWAKEDALDIHEILDYKNNFLRSDPKVDYIVFLKHKSTHKTLGLSDNIAVDSMVNLLISSDWTNTHQQKYSDKLMLSIAVINAKTYELIYSNKMYNLFNLPICLNRQGIVGEHRKILDKQVKNILNDLP